MPFLLWNVNTEFKGKVFQKGSTLISHYGFAHGIHNKYRAQGTLGTCISYNLVLGL
jgi:hypothetical protein